MASSEDFLKDLTETPGVSGYEKKQAELIKNYFSPYCDEIYEDKLGNLIALKKAAHNPSEALDLMIAAHMDEIGLIVTAFEDEKFLRISSVGGIDPRTLPGQEVIIHGEEEIEGVIGARPPHLLTKQERNEAPKWEKLFVDPGLSGEKLKKKVSVGDLITVKRNLLSLENNSFAGKALDDRAGVVLLYEILKELEYLNNNVNLYAVATTQEEVGIRGSETSTYHINPDIGIAVDVCHGKIPGVEKDLVSKMGEGPVIAYGPQVHPKVYKKLKEIADDNQFDYQIEPSPHPYGTDAASMQISRGGVATGLISIPLRYMHTSVETLSFTDIKMGGKLLAHFSARIDNNFKEELLCY